METSKNTTNMSDNMKIFPLYKALAWDTLFYYAIEFLFLTGVKGLSAAQVLFVDAFYPLFKFILEIPSNIIVQKLGKRRSLILGNLFVVADLLLLILATNIYMIILAWFFSGFGYALKGLTESNLLYDSIPKTDKRGDIFAKIDGRANSIYYYFDAISAISTGFLFVVNGYLPMLLSLGVCIISLLLSLRFKDVDTSPNPDTQSHATSTKQILKDLKQTTKFIINSKRLRSLVIFNGFFCAFLAMYSSLRSSYENRTLSIFATRTTISFIILGLSTMIGLNFALTLEIILVMMAIQYAIKGPFYTLIKRYLNNFTTSNMRTKISLVTDLLYSILSALLRLFCSFLLGFTTTAYVYVILGCIFTVFFIFLLDYMKNTVGLKPEQYPEKEIKFTALH